MSDGACIAELLGNSHLPRLEARILLAHVLNQDMAWLLAHDDEALSAEQYNAYMCLVRRRALGEPIAYLVGHKEFWGMCLRVSPAVLIPRPETEALVERALTFLATTKKCAAKKQTVLDLGTGTGAVALALALERKDIRIDAVDFSTEALALMRENVKTILGEEQRQIMPIHSRWFYNLPCVRAYDLIVSNPPYIAESDPHLSVGDVRFEPQSALRSGVDGLDDIREIIATAPMFLKAGGALLFEHGYDQAHTVKALLVEQGFRDVATTRDLAGVERVTGGIWCLSDQ